MSNATGLPDRKPEKKQAPRKNTASDKLREMPASAAKEAPREVPKKAESTGAEKSSTALRPGGEVADLYIVHGWTYTVEPWAETLEILRKNGVKAKMLNVPGLTVESDKVFDIDDYVKWADEMIPDGAVALGHSNGGRILLNLCAEKPGKLKYLILLDSAGIYETTLKKKMVGLLAKIGRPLKKIPVVDKVFHRLTGTTDYSKAPENMKKTLVNMLESDRTLDLKKVTTKTFILWGKKDTTTPPRQATKMYEELPNADLKFYANWTHAPYIADPEGLARAILALVKRVNK
ncbi:alpha/beta hydrolase [Candidatus Saccharibacteria bacterium]|nr:alpha/beta hydrolase [Candidatus Saccharibacteria bacterium]